MSHNYHHHQKKKKNLATDQELANPSLTAFLAVEEIFLATSSVE